MACGRRYSRHRAMMLPLPHWRDCINPDGTYNFSAIMRIAINHAKVGVSILKKYGRTDPWMQILARELRTVWQVARGMKCDFDRRAA